MLQDKRGSCSASRGTLERSLCASRPERSCEVTVREVFLGEIRIPHFLKPATSPLILNKLACKPDKALPGIDSLQPIVKILTENDCIGVKELGVLEQTCKTARITICSEEVWEALCLRRWPNTIHFNRKTMGRLGGYRGLYKRRISKPPLREKSPPEEQLPPPTLKKKDLVFFVDIWANGKPVISTALPGDHIGIGKEDSTIERKGGVGLIDQKTVGNIEYELGTMNEIQNADEFVSDQFTVEVQMVTPSRTCAVVTPNVHFWFDRRGVMRDCENNESSVLPIYDGNVRDISTCRLRSTLLGSAIKQRLGGEVSLLVYPIARLIDKRRKLVVDSLEFVLYVGEAKFDKQVRDETGVSSLHVLENLEGSPISS